MLNTEWLDIAFSEIGEKEIAGPEDNPRIVEYHQSCSLKATDDETPWCSAFANWVFDQLKKEKITPTRSAAALSWLKWGKKLLHPAYGCVVIYDHGGGRGHVGFCVGYKKVKNKFYLAVLGGNQSNQVKVSFFEGGTAAGYRWPVSSPIPEGAFSLPLIEDILKVETETR